MNSGHLADQAADRLEAADRLGKPLLVVTRGSDGPLLSIYRNGQLVDALDLSPKQAVSAAVEMLREVRI